MAIEMHIRLESDDRTLTRRTWKESKKKENSFHRQKVRASRIRTSDLLMNVQLQSTATTNWAMARCSRADSPRSDLPGQDLSAERRWKGWGKIQKSFSWVPQLWIEHRTPCLQDKCSAKLSYWGLFSCWVGRPETGLFHRNALGDRKETVATLWLAK